MIWGVVLLFALGVLLVLLEFLLPGLILGILGLSAIVGSIAYAVYLYPEHTVLIVVGESLAAVLAISLGLFAMSRTGLLGSMIHKSDQRLEEGYSNLAQTEIRPGMRGVVVTPLRASGTIEIGDDRVDAVSNGGYIEAGVEVTVLEVHGNRVVVEVAGEKVSGDEGGPSVNAQGTA